MLLHLVDAKNPAAKEASKAALERIGAFNRRTLDVLLARLVFYYSLVRGDDTNGGDDWEWTGWFFL